MIGPMPDQNDPSTLARTLEPTTEAVLAKRLDVNVVSKANPRPEHLIQARADLQTDSELKRFREEFSKGGRSKEWLADMMAVRLGGLWAAGQVPFSEIQDTATYLADESQQLGEGIFLSSTETGKITVALDEDDIYQPAPVPREGGGMAQPLMRIRPDIEASIVCHFHEKAREERILGILREKLPQTRLVIDETDARLRIATRTGRSAIVESVTQLAPKTLLGAAGGTAGTFLKRLDIVTELSDDWESEAWKDLGSDVAVARSKLGIQDPTTFNLSYNRAAVLRGSIPQEWARKIAFRLAEGVHKERPNLAIPADELSLEDLQEVYFWILPPDAIGLFKRLDPRIQAMPVEGVQPLGLPPDNKIGVLKVAESFGASSKELFTRWETEAHLEYQLWANMMSVLPLRVTGLAHAGVVV